MANAYIEFDAITAAQDIAQNLKSLPYGVGTPYARASPTGDVFTIDVSVGVPGVGTVALTMRFGPQGRNFDNEIRLVSDVSTRWTDLRI